MDDITQATILLVDDEAANLTLLVAMLLARGFQLTVAESGESALARVRYRRPDVILLDVRMPGIDGFETCRRLKGDAQTADIPVIFLSAATDGDDKQQGFAAGGVDYIAKPIDVNEVLLRVQAQLTLRRLHQALAAANADLEQRVRERTAALAAEVERRTQSEEEKGVLLEIVRAQSQQLQQLNQTLLAAGSDRRQLLTAALEQQVAGDLHALRAALGALGARISDPAARQTVDELDARLAGTLESVAQLADDLQHAAPAEQRAQSDPLVQLSERELEVFGLLAQGVSYDRIAALLHISKSSVRTYRYRIMQKLGTVDPTDPADP